MFWKKRLVDGHPQRPWMPGTKNYEDESLQIYGAGNQYKAQRLEGYIHLSPTFQVPSTKDGIRWEGKEEKLIKELKKFLENATIYRDNSGKKYNFLRQCNSIPNIVDSLPDEPIDSDGIIDEFTPDEEDVIIIPSDIEDDEPELGFFDDDLKTYPVQYEGTTWEVDIKTILKEDENFIKLLRALSEKTETPKEKLV